MADDAPDSPESERENPREQRTDATTDGPGTAAVVDDPEPESPTAESPDADAENTAETGADESAADAGADEGDEPDGFEGEAEDAPTDKPDEVRSPEDVDESEADEPPEDVDESEDSSAHQDPPEDVQKYQRFTKMDGAQYDRVNEFLRDRTHITAREWAIARLCSDFRTETGVEMTKIGENLPELVPFMTDTYSPQAVNQARTSFKGKVRKAGATFLYGAMCNFFTAEELDEVMYEATEVAKFLLEVEGVDLTVDEELEAEDRISSVMREVRQSSEELRHDHAECPHCGGDLTDD